jgi:hypothetical protein
MSEIFNHRQSFLTRIPAETLLLPLFSPADDRMKSKHFDDDTCTSKMSQTLCRKKWEWENSPSNQGPGKIEQLKKVAHKSDGHQIIDEEDGARKNSSKIVKDLPAAVFRQCNLQTC